MRDDPLATMTHFCWRLFMNSVLHMPFFRSITRTVMVASVVVAGCTISPEDVSEDDRTRDDAIQVDDGEIIDQDGQPSIASLETTEATALTAAAAACTIAVSESKQLMITNLSVVNDLVRTRWTGSLSNPSDGAWHFGRLMTEMAGANDPTTFVRSWLGQWERPVTVNGQIVPARTGISRIINAWPKTSAGKLDLTKAPFRLLAIVNRFDLRSAGNAGEGRFVFGVLDGTSSIPQFTVILEYKMLAATAADVRIWADLWKDLGTAAIGSAAARTKLQAITDRFTRRDAGPGRINGSAVSQVRSNEIALASPWELREFRLTTTGQLRMATTALTPAHDGTLDLNNTSTLATFMTQNATAITAQTHSVPLLFAGQPFRGAHVFTNSSRDFWNAPGITNSTLRHRFSLNTCNGCHGGETQTTFLHVSPRAASAESALSGFLTGVSVRDPVTGIPRTLDDLANRAAILTTFLCAAP
jgi:hypothetical protein